MEGLLWAIEDIQVTVTTAIHLKCRVKGKVRLPRVLIIMRRTIPPFARHVSAKLKLDRGRFEHEVKGRRIGDGQQSQAPKLRPCLRHRPHKPVGPYRNVQAIG